MDNTSKPATRGIGRVLRLQYVSAVCGVAVAVSSAVAIGGWEGSSPRASSGAGQVTPPVGFSSRAGGTSVSREAPATLIVFLVGSEAQRDAVLAADRGATVFLVRTREEEDAAAINIYEMSEGRAGGGAVQVVDLRFQQKRILSSGGDGGNWRLTTVRLARADSITRSLSGSTSPGTRLQYQRVEAYTNLWRRA